MRRWLLFLSVLGLVILVIAGRNSQFVTAEPAARPGARSAAVDGPAYTLQTAMRDGRMVYMGVGGEIDGVINPDLVVQAGTQVRVTLINGDGMAHDFSIGNLGVATPMISVKGKATDAVFAVAEEQAGTYDYFCTVSGHRQAGMAGKFSVR